MISRRVSISLVLLSVVSALFSSIVTAGVSEGLTTLDRTIVAEGNRDLGYGPGQARITRAVAWDVTRGKGTPLGGLKHVSDIHVIDEESPGRLEFFDLCDPSLRDSYRVQDSLTTQVGDSMLAQLGAIDAGPATAAPLTFTVSTGDNIDSNQFNELRWFIDLLDGNLVEPNSGADTYDGFTKAEFKGSLPTETLEMAQDAFDAVGSDVPWYAVQGNHDGLIRGVVAGSPQFNSLVIGDKKPFIGLKEYDDCPSDAGGGVVGSALRAITGPNARTIPADPDRHFMSRDEIVAEYFNTTGLPVGHGLESAPNDPVSGTRASYYAFEVAPGILGLSLDAVNYEGGGDGSIPDPQFAWLEEQLIAASSRYYATDGTLQENPEGTDQLIVLFSHQASDSMGNPGTDTDYAPYHCFRPSDAEGCGGEGLKSLLTRFPNVVAWVNGHGHKNRLRSFKVKDGDPDRAFWEVHTASHVDWPQQSRVIEFAWKPGADGGPDTFFIYVTTVDHAAAPDPDLAAQSVVDYLASISRVEAYFDACVRPNQANCGNRGKAKHRNAKLVQKAPFDLGP